jgi:hypothetical protein
MVNYRLHNLSMTNTLRARDVAIESRDELTLCWRMKEKISASGHRSLERHCKRQIYHRYFAQLIGNLMNLEEFELSLHSFAKDARERESIEKQVLGKVVFRFYLEQEFQRARELYDAARRKRWTSPVLWADYIFLKLGRNGIPLARAVSLLKRRVIDVIARLEDLCENHLPLRNARKGI